MIIVNIVLINFGYNIATDVKIFSSVLLSLDCLLLWHYRRRYQFLVLPEASLDELLKSREGSRTAGADERAAVDPGPEAR